jgi:hypothetical protein
MHADKVWKGGANPTTVLHVKENVAPAPETLGIAYVNTVNVLRAYREGSLNPKVYSGTLIQNDE